MIDLAMVAYEIELHRILKKYSSWLASYEAHVMEAFR